MYLYVFLISLIFSSLICYSYILAWNRFISKKRIATGYGFIVTIFLILIDIYFENNFVNFKFYSILLLFSFVYWFDDLKKLSSSFRLILQFFSGAIIAFIAIKNNDLVFNYSHIIIIITSGLISIFLTNVINFYDGSDLNVSVLIIIIALTCLFLINLSQYYKFIWTVVLGFILGFIFFNIKPNKVFFGDSGCFVISFLLNLMIIESILVFNYEIVYLLIPLSLPIVDVFYVILKKFKLKESLMIRNYYHLYHVVEKKSKSMLYLIPQIFNSIMIYILSLMFFINHNYDLAYFVILSFLITVTFYFFIKKFII